jgi:hypothetical protein
MHKVWNVILCAMWNFVVCICNLEMGKIYGIWNSINLLNARKLWNFRMHKHFPKSLTKFAYKQDIQSLVHSEKNNPKQVQH